MPSGRVAFHAEGGRQRCIRRVGVNRTSVIVAQLCKSATPRSGADGSPALQWPHECPPDCAQGRTPAHDPAVILTITANPALDLATTTQRLEPAHKLRCAPALQFAGGGGINVARVLHRLGARVSATYLAGGPTGARLQALIEAEGLAATRLPIAAETRENFSVLETETGREYRFVLPGPQVSRDEWQALLEHVAGAVPDAATVVLSGSLPPGVPDEGLAQLARCVRTRGARVVLDASGAALAAALAEGVDLVKPSLREMRELTGQALAGEADWLVACRAWIERGQARQVALSLGGQGAMLVSAQGAWRADALQVPVVSSTGAGDSFLAALVWAQSRGLEGAEALAHAVAGGSAALLSAGTALCQPEDLQRLLPQVRVRRL